MSEFQLLKNLLRTLPTLSEAVLLGPGDDAAVVMAPAASLLMSCDSMVEKVHFDPRWSSPSDVGYKAVQTTISDIAAMGGIPHYLTIALGLRLGSDDWALEAYRGISQACQATGTVVVGGDVTTSSANFLNIHVTGSAPNTPKTRRDGLPGDLLFTTGPLGTSRTALKLLQMDVTPPPSLLEQFNRPKARVKEGTWLAERPEVGAMIDLSDGLAGDLAHVCEQSACGARVELSILPLTPLMVDVCEQQGWDSPRLAASGGEDYELLLSVRPDQAAALCKDYADHMGRPLHHIGELNEGTPSIDWMWSGVSTSAPPPSFEHLQ